MAIVPDRKWWIDINKWTIFRGYYWQLSFRIDYYSFRFIVCTKWVGIHLAYLDPQDWSPSRLESTAKLLWEQQHPLSEGMLIFKNHRMVQHIHKEDAFHRAINWGL